MATEVLRPQDVLAGRFRVHPTSFHRRRILQASGNLTNLVENRKQHRKTYPPKPDKRRFNFAAVVARRSSHHDRGVPGTLRRVEATSGGPLSMGQVTLLRRGESLSSIASPIAGGNPSDPIRNPVDDLSGTKQIRPVAGPSADIYAGSAFSMSPSPKSVPLPLFFNKGSNDGATSDLRRLLRLE